MNINMILIMELVILIMVLQIVPFSIYGIDKLFAKLGFFRIPEKARSFLGYLVLSLQ